MTGLSPLLIAGAVVTLGVIMGLGVYTGRQVKDAKDFNEGGSSAGAVFVTGAILGTLVGGNSTVGTAQLAFTSGLSALWFTIGSALGCLVLGLVFSGPMRESGCTTIQQIVRREFGETAGIVTSILSTVGMFLNIVGQVLAANALFMTLFGLSNLASGLLSVIVIACYVLFGGIKGAGLLGTIKMGLLYLAVMVGGVMALRLGGGLSGLFEGLPKAVYFNFFSRGVGVDIGAGISVLLGVLSTQTYMQAVLSGKSNEAASRGAYLGAVLIPLVGIFSTIIGLYMRMAYPEMVAAQAFPQFVLQYMPPLFAGVVLATLLIAVVGTASGMALGLSNVLATDIYKRYVEKQASGKKTLLVTRVLILVSLVVSLLFTTERFQGAILTWGFLSMGLRAVVLFAPMCAALFFPGKISGKYAVASSVLGVLAMPLGKAMSVPFDTLFIGMGVSIVILLAGRLAGGGNAAAD